MVTFVMSIEECIELYQYVVHLTLMQHFMLIILLLKKCIPKAKINKSIIWIESLMCCIYPISSSYLLYTLILTGIHSWFLPATIDVYLMVIIFLVSSAVIVWNSSIKKSYTLPPFIHLFNHYLCQTHGS